uniref:Uncharacterized protein n=1 Tax=Romanomermis culicivorax TaxID=13658 RepID=A0A915HVB4_ROMCU
MLVFDIESENELRFARVYSIVTLQSAYQVFEKTVQGQQGERLLFFAHTLLSLLNYLANLAVEEKVNVFVLSHVVRNEFRYVTGMNARVISWVDLFADELNFLDTTIREALIWEKLFRDIRDPLALSDTKLMQRFRSDCQRVMAADI